MWYRGARVSRKDALWMRTGGRCGYCGCRTKAVNRTRDHIIPKAKGGRTTSDNLLASCRQCNQSKADMDVGDFRDRYFGGNSFYIEWIEGIWLSQPVATAEAAD